MTVRDELLYMVAEHDRGLVEGAVALLVVIADSYRDARDTVGNYTPYGVRMIEVLLAAALFVGLAYWLYLFFTFDPGPP